MDEPWMETLAPVFHVVAVDTPGYGGSDPLPIPVTQLSDYLAPLCALLQTVAGPQCLLYGSATGAQLGIAFANRHPGAVKHLLLSTCSWTTQRTLTTPSAGTSWRVISPI